MNWIYTMMFAGLMLAGNMDEIHLNHRNSHSGERQNLNTEKNVKLEETEKFAQSYPFDTNGTVSVSNVNGSITIEASDDPQIKLEVVKIGDSRETLADVEVKIEARQNTFRLETDYGGWKKGGNNWINHRKLEVNVVNIRMTVPRTAALNEIETVNGSVTVADFTGYTKISAVNGDVRATNLRGNSNLSTVNGKVEADFQTLEAVQKISLETVNGQVHLTMPTDADATLRADTLNGEITNDFGLLVRKGQYVGKDLYGKLGSGATGIKLSSVNGELSVKHRADGKNLRPATNLLNRQNSEQEDETADNQEFASASELAGAKRQAAELMKQQKKALEQAQKEMRNQRLPTDYAALQALEQAKNAVDSPEARKAMFEAMKIQRETAVRDGYFDFVNNPATKIEKKSETFAVKGTPKITVNAGGGAVSVRGWDRAEVAYSLKRISKTGGQKPIDYTVNHSDSAVSLVVGKAASNNNYQYLEGTGKIQIEIFVPRKADLKIVTDGQIRLEGVTGNLDLSGDGEAINVRDAGGKLKVVSENGLVRIIGFDGELKIETDEGNAYLEGDFSRLDAVSGNGEIVLTLPENANAEIESNQNSLVFKGIKPATAAKTSESTSWKIGQGGVKYRLFNENEGRITVQSRRSLIN